MKVALVHELLTLRGGAERVLRVFAEMFPEAPIYTLLYDEKKLGDWFPRHRVRSAQFPAHYALLPNFQFSIFNFQFRFNHHLYLSKFPQAIEAWDFSAFDLVISSSSAFAHNIITNGKPKHLSFIHSPARYLWDRTHDVLEQAGSGLFGPLKRMYLKRVFHTLRLWDAESAARADLIIVSSKEVQRRVELYWRRGSTVVYPPIDDFWLHTHDSPLTTHHSPLTIHDSQSYFLVVSTLVPYKRIELAIAACNTLNIPLVIVGEGPDRKRLQKLAGPTVTFLGYSSKENLSDLYRNAKATIVPGDEDFNLVALESMACGTPVIAFGAGGPLETVIEGATGEFFREPTAESLEKILSGFDRKRYQTDTCQNRAKEFSKETFQKNIRAEIDRL